MSPSYSTVLRLPWKVNAAATWCSEIKLDIPGSGPSNPFKTKKLFKKLFFRSRHGRMYYEPNYLEQ